MTALDGRSSSPFAQESWKSYIALCDPQILPLGHGGAFHPLLERAAAVFFIEDQAGSRRLDAYPEDRTLPSEEQSSTVSINPIDREWNPGVPKEIFVLVTGHDHRNEGSLQIAFFFIIKLRSPFPVLLGSHEAAGPVGSMRTGPPMARWGLTYSPAPQKGPHSRSAS